MNDMDKTKEELLKELQELRQEFNFLKASNDKDVIGWKKTEDSLQQTSQNYETFFNAVDDFLFVLDIHGNIIKTNATVVERLGYTNEELSGKSILIVHPSERYDEVSRIVSKLSGGVTEFCTVPIITKSGVQIQAETKFVNGIWDDKPVVFGVTKDISRIRLSEEKFSKLFHISPSACGLSDLDDHKYVEVNEAFYTLLGFEKNEVIGKTAMDLGISTAEKMDIILLKADSNGNINNVEADLKAKNGDIKHVLLSSENIYVQDKKYRYTVVHDITGRKQAEQALADEKLRLSSIIQGTNAGTWEWNIQTGEKIYNERWAEFIGYTLEELSPVSIDTWIKHSHPEDIKVSDELLKKHIKGELDYYECEIRMKHKNGNWIWILDRGKVHKWDENGKPLVMSGTHQNITERKQAEEALHDSEEKYSKAFLTSPYAITITSAEDGKFLEVNDVFTSLSGFTKEELVDNSAVGLNMWVDTEDQKSVISALLDGREVAGKEFLFRKKNGEIRTGLFYAKIIHIKNKPYIISSFNDITGRKLAENILQDIIDKNPISIQIVDKEGFTLKVNPAHTLLFGSIPPSDFSIFNDSQLKKQGFGGLIERIKNGEVVRFPDVLYNVHDSVPEMPDLPVWIRAVAFPIKDTNGKPEKFIFMHEDITVRKQTEQTLRDSEENFRSIFDNNSGAIAIIEPDTSISMVNREFCLRSGYLKQDIIGKSWTQLLPPKELERLKEYNRRRLINPSDAPDKYDFSFYKKNGETRQVIGSFSMLSNQKMIASFIDITERKQTEEALKESEEKYSKAFQTSSYAITLTNVEDGKFIEVNDAFSSITGFSREEAIANSSVGLNVWVDIEDRKRVVSSLLEGRKIEQKEFLFKKKNGEIITGLFSADIIQLSGKPYILSSINDITERKKVELELINAKEKAEESERLKSAFLANMSHEIRTPMNGILGFTEILKEPNLTVEEQQGFIRTIGISSERLLSTINSIVDMSKIESGLINIDFQETNINEKMEFVYKFFKPEVEGKGIKFSFKNTLPAKEAIIKTDPNKIHSILTNLVKNAIKFTNKGSIEFGYVLKSESEPGAAEQCRSAELEFFVKDTGVGIHQKQKNIIFERFRQGSESLERNYEGTGLGLSISKTYVEMLNGKIWVESEEKKGSVFYFTIPYNVVSEEMTAIKDDVSTADKEVQIRKLKILIAEDDEISGIILTKMIGVFSREIIYAKTGVDAIVACHNNPDLDLVLMDIKMPDMDGYEATRQIRQFNSEVIIIAQTAYAFKSDREKAIDAGCNGFISKPIDKTLLFELIRKHFNN